MPQDFGPRTRDDVMRDDVMRRRILIVVCGAGIVGDGRARSGGNQPQRWQDTIHEVSLRLRVCMHNVRMYIAYIHISSQQRQDAVHEVLLCFMLNAGKTRGTGPAMRLFGQNRLPSNPKLRARAAPSCLEISTAARMSLSFSLIRFLSS